MDAHPVSIKVLQNFTRFTAVAKVAKLSKNQGGLTMRLANGLLALAVASFGMFSALPAFAEIVEFRIPAGTGRANWNSPETMVSVAMGDTLRIINDDSIVHTLHTNGRPCGHGSDMAAGGGYYDCVITRPFDAEIDGPLYDHYNSAAKFWLVVE
jgi:hypothetical protein